MNAMIWSEDLGMQVCHKHGAYKATVTKAGYIGVLCVSSCPKCAAEHRVLVAEINMKEYGLVGVYSYYPKQTDCFGNVVDSREWDL